MSLFFYARRRAACGRSPPDAVLRPSDFFAPLFSPSESEPPFHGTKTGFPTELPRQVFCKPGQHSPLLPFCLPAIQKSLSLLFIINFYPHASCLQLSHPLFGTRSHRRHAAFSESCSDRRCCPLFRNPVRTKFPAGRSSSLFYIVLFRIYLSAVAASAFRNPLKSQACRFFRNPVRTKLPAETFHPLRHRGPPCDKRTAAYPSNDVQVGNDLHASYRIGRFSFCLTTFPTAHTTFPTHTASASLPQHLFFLLKRSARPTAQQLHVRSPSVPMLPARVTPSEQIMPERHYRKNFSLKKCTAK